MLHNSSRHVKDPAVRIDNGIQLTAVRIFSQRGDRRKRSLKKQKTCRYVNVKIYISCMNRTTFRSLRIYNKRRNVCPRP